MMETEGHLEVIPRERMVPEVDSGESEEKMEVDNGGNNQTGGCES